MDRLMVAQMVDELGSWMVRRMVYRRAEMMVGRWGEWMVDQSAECLVETTVVWSERRKVERLAEHSVFSMVEC